ncbi:MAG: UDP-N-acetylglucosamine--N-acetylmuramyl-(pentapeptide) pyrophosphoryl-undecaprenol N-acetylglucosamine transferase [Chloroflexota bacterium]
MRLMVSGGGTGGHVYPILTVLEAVKQRMDAAGEDLQVLYVGGAENIEANLADREGIPFEAIAVGGLRGLPSSTMLRNGLKLARGLMQSMSIMRRYRPDVLFVTGGYVCAPVVTAAWVRGCPALLFLPDIQPGLAVRTLAHLVKEIAVSFEASRAYLPAGKVVVTGYPVRGSLQRRTKSVARENLGLSQDEPVLLVFGGSRGAHSINVAVAEILTSLVGACEVLHVCGADDLEWLSDLRQGMSSAQRSRYRIYGYLHEEMGDAMAAADLAIARAGAATMGEFPAVGLPAILVPYPYSGRHQEPNADYLVAQGAAVKLDNGLLQEHLWPTVRELLGDSRCLSAMADRAHGLFVSNAADRIAMEITRLAGRKSLAGWGVVA